MINFTINENLIIKIKLKTMKNKIYNFNIKFIKLIKYEIRINLKKKFGEGGNLIIEKIKIKNSIMIIFE